MSGRETDVSGTSTVKVEPAPGTIQGFVDLRSREDAKLAHKWLNLKRKALARTSARQ
jgi:hypothetical protein